jgi:hypothetical protein
VDTLMRHQRQKHAQIAGGQIGCEKFFLPTFGVQDKPLARQRQRRSGHEGV